MLLWAWYLVYFHTAVIAYFYFFQTDLNWEILLRFNWETRMSQYAGSVRSVYSSASTVRSTRTLGTSRGHQSLKHNKIQWYQKPFVKNAFYTDLTTGTNADLKTPCWYSFINNEWGNVKKFIWICFCYYKCCSCF